RGEGPDPATEPSPQGQVTTEISLSPGASGLVVAEDAVWVAVPDAVVRIDPESGEVLGEIEIEGITSDSIFATGGESIWVTAASPKYAGRTPDVVRLDPATGEVTDRVTLSSELSAIGFSDGYLVYGAAGEGIGTIGRYDPETGEFRDSRGAGGDGTPSAIVATEDAFWVAGSARTGGLSRVSSDLSRSKAIPGIGSVGSLAVAGGYLWVQDDELLQVDLSSGEIVARRHVPGLEAVASDGSTLWLLAGTASSPVSAIQIDPMAGQPVGDRVELAHSTPARLSVGEGVAWITFEDEGVLVSVRPLRN
ncbi:MAG TPA: PQQ-binding-like beta-propeller repeat protein, partial [Actinomycetota bacterium]